MQEPIFKIVYKYKTGDGWVIFDDLDSSTGLMEFIKMEVDANMGERGHLIEPFTIEIKVDEMSEDQIAALPEY